MAITTLDPKTALIVIDLQQGITAMAPRETVAPVIANAAMLADAFRRHNLPVVLVNVIPSPVSRRADQVRNLPELPPGFAEIIPELKAQPSDHRVTKHSWGAFTDTGLDDWLKGQGVTQVVIVGVSTSIGVESTARQAYEAGFNIAFATDAVADLVPEAQVHSLTRIFPRLGETGSTQDIVRLLEGA